MKFKNVINVSCAEAAGLCNKAEYREASLLEKLRLQLHLYFCRTCKKYNERNQRLSSLLKQADLKTCSQPEKEAFRKKIEEQQSKTPEDNESHQP